METRVNNQSAVQIPDTLIKGSSTLDFFQQQKNPYSLFLFKKKHSKRLKTNLSSWEKNSNRILGPLNILHFT